MRHSSGDIEYIMDFIHLIEMCKANCAGATEKCITFTN